MFRLNSVWCAVPYAHTTFWVPSPWASWLITNDRLCIPDISRNCWQPYWVCSVDVHWVQPLLSTAIIDPYGLSGCVVVLLPVASSILLSSSSSQGESRSLIPTEGVNESPCCAQSTCAVCQRQVSLRLDRWSNNRVPSDSPHPIHEQFRLLRLRSSVEPLHRSLLLLAGLYLSLRRRVCNGQVSC